MGVMESIQRRSDNILDSIETQKQILDQLEQEATEAEERKHNLVQDYKQLDQMKGKLEREVVDLRTEQNVIKKSMEANEQAMIR